MKVLFLSLLLFPLFSIFAEKKSDTIHIYVALCDNVHQGIVPVSKALGNGKDPHNNLYWGAMYGVKTFFKRSKNWKLVKVFKNPKNKILERVIFKHKKSGRYLIADAYDGQEIKQTVLDFLEASSGGMKEVIELGDIKIEAGGNSGLIAYVGHDGLMDFLLTKYSEKKDEKKRDAVILACASKSFFKDAIKASGAYPLLWTTDLMAPEAYTLLAIVESWIKGESRDNIRLEAAKAYHKYQKCGLNGAKRLLVTGW